MDNKWIKVKIPEILFFQEGPGVRKHQFRSEGVKLLNGGNINDNKINLSNTKIFISNEEAYGKYKHFLVDEGDLVIASSGIVVDNFHKKIAFIKKEHLPLCMNTSTIRFKPLSEKIDINYFKFFLQTNSFKYQLSKLITGSAQLNFGPSHLKQIDIALPPISEQKRIVSILDKANKLIERRKETIKLLDEYLNSLFYKKFIANSGYTIVKLEDITNKITDGVHLRPKYIDKGIPFISVVNITNKKLDFNGCKFISKDDHEQYIKRCNPNINDILYTKVGATYGRACMVDTENKFSLYVSVALIKPNSKFVNPLYLKFVLNSNFVKKQADRSVKGAGVPDLHLVEIKKFQIPLPPLNIQTEFSEFVIKVNLVKIAMQKQLNEMESNFNSLMQTFFINNE